MKKFASLIVLVLVSALILTGCGGGGSTNSNEQKLKVGVTAGPHEEVLEKVKEVAKLPYKK